MSLIYASEVPDPQSLFLRDPQAVVVEWQGLRALKLSGQGACLLVVPDLLLPQGRIEVEIGAQGAAYAGIAFRLIDSLNYELAYAQPHTTGKWDALQYDPVFHGSNTWQLYHGSGSQMTTQVPTGSWFTLRLSFQGQRAMLQVDEQPPLWINRLAHVQQDGFVGLWSYLPAHFRQLRVSDDLPDFSAADFPPAARHPTAGMVSEWFLEGFGMLSCEPNGILNLNRYLPVSTTVAHLQREIELEQEGELTFTLGFSDELSLRIDDQEIYHGENLWQDTPEWSERGYVSLDRQVIRHLNRGRYRLTAVLSAREYFGYGMTLRIEGDNYQLLPARWLK
ncbi:MAG: hypothetical protein JXB15_14190 [Anaerolineales bacterium]|nr:hypothetical protein [Anaerolineales bacterium]